MPSDTSPFRDSRHRLTRPVDELFGRAIAAAKAIVRAVGPRRIGKTEMVRNYCRSTGAALVDVTMTKVPADMDPAVVLLSKLNHALTEMGRSAPELKKEFDRLAEKETPASVKRKLGGEVSGGIGGFLRAKFGAEKERTTEPAATPSVPSTEIGAVLSRLEYAAKRLGMRPVVLFDEVQELVVGQKGQHDMSAAWAIRNEVQNHEACRYVFAGSNLRLFRLLSAGQQAPFLNLGTSIEVPLLTAAELDAWAKPLFTAGGRHVNSLALTNELLAGKIGEAADVFNRLWLMTKPGDVIDEAAQREAILGVVREIPADLFAARLTLPQTQVLRWVLEHPGHSPYSVDAVSTLRLNAGTVSAALDSMLTAGLIEHYGERYVATLPLRTMSALQPLGLERNLEAATVIETTATPATAATKKLREPASESIAAKIRRRRRGTDKGYKA